jgi:hypothetical protein
VAVPANLELGVVSTEDRTFFWSFVQEPDPSYALLTPQLSIRRTRLFRELPRDLDPGALARLRLRREEYARRPSLEKCVAEAVFERVRARVAPAAPSRLSCLFAAVDAESAARFAIRWLPDPEFDDHGFSDVGALRVRTGGAPWVAVDMSLFFLPEAIGDSETANERALERTTLRAERYWRGDRGGRPFVEVLATSLAVSAGAV